MYVAGQAFDEDDWTF